MVVVAPVLRTVVYRLDFRNVPLFKEGGPGVIVFLIFPLVLFQSSPPTFISHVLQS
jgi:hypothetical protein